MRPAFAEISALRVVLLAHQRRVCVLCPSRLWDNGMGGQAVPKPGGDDATGDPLMLESKNGLDEMMIWHYSTRALFPTVRCAARFAK